MSTPKSWWWPPTTLDRLSCRTLGRVYGESLSFWWVKILWWSDRLGFTLRKLETRTSSVLSPFLLYVIIINLNIFSFSIFIFIFLEILLFYILNIWLIDLVFFFFFELGECRAYLHKGWSEGSEWGGRQIQGEVAYSLFN